MERGPYTNKTTKKRTRKKRKIEVNKRKNDLH